MERKDVIAQRFKERECIFQGIAAEKILRSIARKISRATSTVRREIQWNDGRARYRAADAGQ